jgi:NOL1/NOP2/sun family putative RNA methylase
MVELPQQFLGRMAGLLGAEYPAFLASYNAAPSVGLRVNTLKITVDEFRRLAPFELSPVPLCAAGFTVTEGDEGDAEPGKHPFHAAGLYYLQDPSAMAVAELLAPQPGELVLDLAAAPGGKATHIAALMQGEGLLVANEIHPKRAWELAENLERWGARNVAITNETPARLADHLGAFFDRVLVDAPCSGEGMLRKSAAARAEWGPELVRGCALRQSAILEQASRLVRPGGWLVYSTCTFNPEENEGTVAGFLEALQAGREFELVEPAWRPGFAKGRPDWLPGGAARPETSRAVRLWPHLGPGEGHFVALLRRRPAGSERYRESKGWRAVQLPKAAEQAYRAFCAKHLPGLPSGQRLALVGTYLYALPPEAPDFSGLRFIHPGWWLGVIKKDRFEPAHALAMGLQAHELHEAVSLAPDDLRLRGYLRGESFGSAGKDAWVILAVDGYPIGWGKRVQGIVKSHYPRGLRRP